MIFVCEIYCFVYSSFSVINGAPQDVLDTGLNFFCFFTIDI